MLPLPSLQLAHAQRPPRQRLSTNRETGKNLIREAFTDQPIRDFR